MSRRRIGPTVTSTGQIVYSVRDILTSPERRKAVEAMKDIPPDPVSVRTHPAIAGLVYALPHPGTVWTESHRAAWIEALQRVFDLVYQK
jgi:hypothetical protein